MTAQRKSAAERREELIAIALEHFALGGYNGTSTEAIAREAGISQPYLFRLFKTKRDLFLACCDRSHERIVATFRDAARGAPRDEALAHMGKGYIELLRDRTRLLFQMQSYAASSDPVIQERVRANYAELVKEVRRLADADDATVWRFCATGMMLNVTAALDFGAIADCEPWAAAWSAPAELIALQHD